MKQIEKVLVGLIRAKGEWMLPVDFMRPESGELFVGYEASARLSEAAKLYPGLIESKQQGRFKARRFRIDCTVADFSALPDVVKDATMRYLTMSGVGKCLHQRIYRNADGLVCVSCGAINPSGFVMNA